MDRVTFTRQLDRFTLSPILNSLAKIRVTMPDTVVLETRGRKTGKPRRVPIGAKVEGDTVWIVAEHGRRTGSVKNIAADPRVRVLAGGKWRTGTAHILAGDDPRKRLDIMTKGSIALTLVETVTRALMTEPLTVRIDLEPSGAPAQ